MRTRYRYLTTGPGISRLAAIKAVLAAQGG